MGRFWINISEWRSVGRTTLSTWRHQLNNSTMCFLSKLHHIFMPMWYKMYASMWALSVSCRCSLSWHADFWLVEQSTWVSAAVTSGWSVTLWFLGPFSTGWSFHHSSLTTVTTVYWDSSITQCRGPVSLTRVDISAQSSWRETQVQSCVKLQRKLCEICVNSGPGIELICCGTDWFASE